MKRHDFKFYLNNVVIILGWLELELWTICECFAKFESKSAALCRWGGVKPPFDILQFVCIKKCSNIILVKQSCLIYHSRWSDTFLRLCILNIAANNFSLICSCERGFVSLSGKDRTEKKLLGFSFLRLSADDATTVYDGLHELHLHRVSFFCFVVLFQCHIWWL